jgi:hypothetical protein
MIDSGLIDWSLGFVRIRIEYIFFTTSGFGLRSGLYVASRLCNRSPRPQRGQPEHSRYVQYCRLVLGDKETHRIKVLSSMVS